MFWVCERERMCVCVRERERVFERERERKFESATTFFFAPRCGSKCFKKFRPTTRKISSKISFLRRKSCLKNR